MTARQHHYLPQYYLRGFTKKSAKKSKLTVIDIGQNKIFETIPRNVGGVRDFNRIDAEGVDQNTLETALSQFDGEVATALKNIEETKSFEGEDRILILNLIALLAIRSPEMRNHLEDFEIRVMEKIMDVALSKREIWESQLRQMEDKGYKVNKNVTYEQMKDFHNRKEYTIKFPNGHHISKEFHAIDGISPYLFARKWLLIESTAETGPFITTDNPVNLTWNDPDKLPPAFKHNPGYGLKSTVVYFAISKNLAVIGEFDGREGFFIGTKELVAPLNSKLLGFTYQQIYTPKLNFMFLDDQLEFRSGSEILKLVKA